MSLKFRKKDGERKEIEGTTFLIQESKQVQLLFVSPSPSLSLPVTLLHHLFVFG